MKYMVLTAKHCDGFLLWDSKVDDYNIMHTPFKRDVCAELAKAAHEAGMGIGWYYSPMDWRDPDCRNAKNAEFVKRMQAELRGTAHQLRQDRLALVRLRRPLGAVGPGAHLRPGPQAAAGDRHQQPLGPGRRAGRRQPQSIGPWADYYTPEQSIGGFDNQHPWESCMTISRRGQWSWGGHEDGVKTFAAVHEHADPLRRRRRQHAAERRPDAQRRDRAGASGPLEGDGRMAGEVWREHLRHAGRPVQARPVRRLDPQRPDHLPARPALARRDADAAGHSRPRSSAARR